MSLPVKAMDSQTRINEPPVCQEMAIASQGFQRNGQSEAR